MEDLQKMMAVALVYRVLVCVYEVGDISHCLHNGVGIFDMNIVPKHLVKSPQRGACEYFIKVFSHLRKREERV